MMHDVHRDPMPPPIDQKQQDSITQQGFEESLVRWLKIWAAKVHTPKAASNKLTFAKTQWKASRLVPAWRDPGHGQKVED